MSSQVSIPSPLVLPDSDAYVFHDQMDEVEARLPLTPVSESQTPQTPTDDVSLFFQRNRSDDIFRTAPEPITSDRIRWLSETEAIATFGHVGSGVFKTVFRALLWSENKWRYVAQITIKKGKLKERESSLRNEAKVAERIDSPYVISPWKMHTYRFFNGENIVESVCAIAPLSRGSIPVVLCNPDKADLDLTISSWQLAEGVAAIHRAGVIHRDLTLKNTLCFDKGRCKISDLGLACVVGSDSSIQGSFLGFPPESQIPAERPGSYHYRSQTFAGDCWALGLMLWQLHYGEANSAALPAALAFRAQRATTHEGKVSPEAFHTLLLTLSQEELDSTLFPEDDPKDEVEVKVRKAIRGLLRVNPEERLSAREAAEILK